METVTSKRSRADRGPEHPSALEKSLLRSKEPVAKEDEEKSPNVFKGNRPCRVRSSNSEEQHIVRWSLMLRTVLNKEHPADTCLKIDLSEEEDEEDTRENERRNVT